MEKLILNGKQALSALKAYIMREFRMKNDAEFVCCMAAVCAACVILL